MAAGLFLVDLLCGLFLLFCFPKAARCQFTALLVKRVHEVCVTVSKLDTELQGKRQGREGKGRDRGEGRGGGTGGGAGGGG